MLPSVRGMLSLAFLTIGSMDASAAGPITSGPVTLVRTGFVFTEGPACDGSGNLYFTDVPAKRIYRLDESGELSVFQEPSHRANGLMVWKEKLFACEADGSLVAYRLGDPKSREVLASEFEDKRFNACNDLVVDKSGGIYFTDPEYSAPRPLPQVVRSVYYREPSGTVRRIIEELPNPNGIILSPDETILYVVPSSQAEIMAYPVEEAGRIGAGRVFTSLAQPEGETASGGDGCTIDTEGNLYVTSGVGVQIFDRTGKSLETIEVREVPANVTFCGPDRSVLMITARTSLYRVETNRKGHVFGGS